MSNYETLEQAIEKLIQCTKEAAGDASNTPSASSAPCIPFDSLALVKKATEKLLETLGILYEFEAVLHDKTASLHGVSNDLMVDAMSLFQQQELLKECIKHLEENGKKEFEPCLALVKTMEDEIEQQQPETAND